MRIEIVTIGDELLLGFTIDTNGAHLARELAAVGVEIVRRSSVGDDADDIAAAVREALDRTGAVDHHRWPRSDRRRPDEAVDRRALRPRHGRSTRSTSPGCEERWRTRFGGALPESNRQQALMPEGARMLVNRHGSAPGIWLEDERGRWVAMLPGVPREMRGMLADELLPLAARARARAAGGAPASCARARCARRRSPRARSPIGWASSRAASTGSRSPTCRATRASTCALTARGLPRPSGRRRARARRAPCCAGAWATYVYGEDADDLAAVVLELCRAPARTLAVAESCTGGLLGARLTAIPGSSDVVLGGVIAYDNAVKIAPLGVAADDARASTAR